MRKELTDRGVDAGAATIHYHLSQRQDQVPSVATIHRFAEPLKTQLRIDVSA